MRGADSLRAPPSSDYASSKTSFQWIPLVSQGSDGIDRPSFLGISAYMRIRLPSHPFPPSITKVDGMEDCHDLI